MPQAAATGVDLVLAGHTHGGQVGLPRLNSLRRPERLRVPLRFRHGHDRVGSTQIYISRGIGTVVLPVRVRCPAEIPVLRLQAQSPADSGPADARAG